MVCEEVRGGERKKKEMKDMGEGGEMGGRGEEEIQRNDHEAERDTREQYHGICALSDLRYSNRMDRSVRIRTSPRRHTHTQT